MPIKRYKEAFLGLLEGNKMLAEAIDKESRENHSLRHLLWFKHGCPCSYPYMKCEGGAIHEPIDFMRDSYEEIFNKLAYPNANLEIKNTTTAETATVCSEE